jgi:hypothetical protein
MLSSLFLFGLCALQSAPALEPPAPPARGVLDQVVVIGASLSGGFGLRGQLEVDFDLARVLELALVAPRAAVHSLGNNLFFRDPLGLGPGQVQRAHELEPSLVVALDFPFWFAYGYRGDCAARLRDLERGLALLEGFECPLLLGDLLDATPALAGGTAFSGGRPVIQRGQIPSPECLARLNERLRAWAAGRDNVHVFALQRFFREAHGPETIVIRGNEYDAARKRTLLQPDLLHPTYRGAAAVTLVALDSLARAGVIEEAAVRWNAAELEDAIWKASAAGREASREKRRERERQRAERKSRREEPSDGDRDRELALEPR